MDTLILAFGTGMLGVSFGYLFGLLTKRWLTPTVKTLQQALETERAYYQTIMGRMKRRIADYEQPPDLMRIAHKNPSNPMEAITMFADNLGSIKEIPKWLRPFIPAIQSYIKENPEQVAQVIEKFITSKPAVTNEGML